MKTSFSNEIAMNGFENVNKLKLSPTTKLTTNEAIIAIDEVNFINPSTAKYLVIKRVRQRRWYSTFCFFLVLFVLYFNGFEPRAVVTLSQYDMFVTVGCTVI